MITLYAAIGKYKISTDGQPFIMAAYKEHALDTHEMIIWSTLAFRIMTYQELKDEFCEREQELHILSDLSFDHYLNRLTMRGLIVKGSDYTGIDALYDLFSSLYIQPLKRNLSEKFRLLFRLFLAQRISLHRAASLFSPPALTREEKKLLSHLTAQRFTVAEIILCKDQKLFPLKDENILFRKLYSVYDKNTIFQHGRTTDLRIPLLALVANLYLKQQIVLQTC